MENLIAEFHAFSDALASAASPQIGNAGMQLWRGLSLIVIVMDGYTDGALGRRRQYGQHRKDGDGAGVFRWALLRFLR